MDDRATSTRRNYLAGGAALLAGGALAGCLGMGGSESASDGGGSGNAEPTKSAGTNDNGSYSAAISPVGEVEFDSVPGDALVVFPQYADMAIALGHGDAVNSVYAPEFSGTVMNAFYDRLPGVSFDWKGLPDPLAEGVSKERLYELDSDVHFIDPSYVVSTQDNWSVGDVEEIADNVAPFFGNYHSGIHDRPATAYRQSYEYYTLPEIFGKVAAVFREEERYEKLASIHADLVSRIESKLPPEGERPTAARVTLIGDTFYAYHLNEPGTWHADTRPLGARDVFAGETWSGTWGLLDYEAMLEADPDVILHLWGMAPGYYIDGIRKTVADHPVGGKLTAIENDRFYAGGMRFQGPLMNLFQLEMTAKQLYPERFGEWPGFVPGEPYPEIPADERLFDRERVAAIVTGDG